MRFRPGRLAPVPSVLLLALSIVTAASFRRVFADWSFLPFFIALATAVHGITALCRYLRVRLWIASPLALITAAAVIGQRMYPTSMKLGLIPTSSTIRFAVDDIRNSWSQFSSTIAPVPATGGFLLVAALSVAVAAYSSDTFALRAYGRVEAVIPSAVVFIFVSVLGEPGKLASRMWITAIWLFTACVAVALLRDDHGDLSSVWLGSGRIVRILRTGTAAALLSVVAVIVAYNVAPHLPGATEVGLINPREQDNQDEGQSTVSPLVDIRGRLTGRKNRIMFRVDASRPYYWHLTSLADFDGKTWQSNERFSSTNGKLRTKPKGASLRQKYTIDGLGDSWVPAAYEAVAISGPVSFVYNPETASVRLGGDDRLSQGLAYTVTSVIGDYSVRQLSRAGSNRPPDDRYLSLPDNFPDDLREQAASIVEGKQNSYAEAVALQDWFRENFEYDLSVSYGSGTKGMREFLEARRGFCEQFASTFAAFARSVGIPARVAVGFTPGVKEDGSYVVRSRNAHAWPEVWFNNVGWVSFEPTPGRGAPGNEDYTGVRPAQDETVEPDTGDTGVEGDTIAPTTTAAPSGGQGSGPASTLPSGAVSGPDGASGAGTETSVPDTLPEDQPEGGGSGGTWLLLLLIAAALGGAVYGWLRVLPDALRKRRLRLGGDEPADRVLHAWQDATVLLGVLGVPRRPDETPLEHATRTRTAVSTFGLDHDALEHLANNATRALYARESVDPARATDCLQISAALGRAVMAHAPTKVKLRIRLDPRLAATLR